MADQDNNIKTTVTTVTRGKGGRFVSTKGMDVPKNIDLEKSLVQILTHLVESQKNSIQFYTGQNEQTSKSNEHLSSIENELTNIEKTIGGLYKFFDIKQKEDNQKTIESQKIERLTDKHLQNILRIEQEQLNELRMLNEQFIDFFEVREKEKADDEQRRIEREREAAQPPPIMQQSPTQQATKEQKKNESFFSSFGSIAKSTFGGLMSFGKSLFSGLGKIFGVLFSVVSAPFKFISSALGSILSFIPGFGIISKLMPSFNMGLGGLLSTLGIGALGYVGFKYLTDDKYKTGVDKYMGGIQKFFAPLIEGIKGFFDTPVGKAISSFVNNLWEKHIKPGLESIKNGIITTLKTFIGEDNWKNMSETFTTIKTWISDHLPKSYKELSDSVKNLSNNIVNFFNVIISVLKEISNYIPGLSSLKNISPLEVPFINQELSKTAYTTEGLFTGSSEQMKTLIDLSRAKEGGGVSQINALSGAAGYHQFMPSTFKHIAGKLSQQDNFLQDVNKTASDLGIQQLSKQDISKIQADFESSKNKSEYIKNLSKDIQDLFFIAFNKDILGTMQRSLGRKEVSPFEMKFAGFGTGNIVPIIKAAERNDQDTTYNILKREYARNNNIQLSEQDLNSLTYNGSDKEFYELAKKSKYGNFEKLVTQNPNLFYALEGKKYNENKLLKPQETIDQYKKYLNMEIKQSNEKNIDQNIKDINLEKTVEDAKIKRLGATAGVGIMAYGLDKITSMVPNKGAQYAGKFIKWAAPLTTWAHHTNFINWISAGQDPNDFPTPGVEGMPIPSWNRSNIKNAPPPLPSNNTQQPNIQPITMVGGSPVNSQTTIINHNYNNDNSKRNFTDSTTR